MRNFILLAGTAMLAACGGAGTESAGSVAVTPPAGPGAGTAPAPTASFVNPTEPKTYQAIGAAQHYEYSTRSDGNAQHGQLYAGDANTVRDSGISVTYNPRDAIFELSIARDKAAVSVAASRFQDPAHRTDFGGAREPQAGVPELPEARKIQYLQSAAGEGFAVAVPGGYDRGEPEYSSSAQTLFYQKPGTTTRYVTYAGYVRNILATSLQSREVRDPATGAMTTVEYLENTYSLDRAAFAYGERSEAGAIPRTGTGSYTGDMLATMVHNPMLDVDSSSPTYFQWIVGSNTTTVDFGTLGVTTALTGVVTAPTHDSYTSGVGGLAEGTSFTANAKATIDMVAKGGFTGSFTDAKFGADLAVAIAGSSIDGAFFGPAADEVGGGFRIVGGTPDERIDILGAFTGKK